MQEFQYFSIQCCAAQVTKVSLAVLANTAHNSRMETVRATDLKNRLGEVLAKARLHPVAIERHGKVVAYLSATPPSERPSSRFAPAIAAPAAASDPRPSLNRLKEERLVSLCASGDRRPSRWRRAGDPRQMAGIAVMLASQEPEFDRNRLLVLAESLSPGMTSVETFQSWLDFESPVRAATFLPKVSAELRNRTVSEAGSASSPRSSGKRP
jgi:antitoxin (DNA-binding transcriptional repressor) of toxin-antitoxin stability system